MLNIKNIQVNYGGKIALQDVSLTASRGKVVALIGPNGAGKSTLIRAISGTITPLSGILEVDGWFANHLSAVERAHLMAVVPQARQLGGAYTVWQAVMMGRTAYMGWLGRESKKDIIAVETALARTRLKTFSDTPIAHLSGGEQQRVLLARALAQETPILLLDEPTNHLDLHHQIEFLKIIRTLTIEKNIAVIMAMHDLSFVAAIADQVVLLVKGKVFTQGDPDRVLTEDNLRDAYQVNVRTLTDPENGKSVIIPQIDASHDPKVSR